MKSYFPIDCVLLFFQTLVANGLRERVILRVDGGFRSGVDVMMAAIMGADEYGFGSVAMIATGCVMARICHTNNCPVGVASQVFRNLICYYMLLCTHDLVNI